MRIPVQFTLFQEIRTSDQLYIQGIRKIGCQAHIDVHEYRIY